MGFSPNVKEKVLVTCGRKCAICRKFCGMKIEIHHIKFKAKGGEDTFLNAIPLCFDCHADMRSYDHHHPKGTKYTESELISHRDQLYKQMSALECNSKSSDLVKALRELSLTNAIILINVAKSGRFGIYLNEIEIELKDSELIKRLEFLKSLGLVKLLDLTFLNVRLGDLILDEHQDNSYLFIEEYFGDLA